jgi:hypothetical protein
LTAKKKKKKKKRATNTEQQQAISMKLRRVFTTKTSYLEQIVQETQALMRKQ